MRFVVGLVWKCDDKKQLRKLAALIAKRVNNKFIGLFLVHLVFWHDKRLHFYRNVKVETIQTAGWFILDHLVNETLLQTAHSLSPTLRSSASDCTSALATVGEQRALALRILWKHYRSFTLCNGAKMRNPTTAAEGTDAQCYLKITSKVKSAIGDRRGRQAVTTAFNIQ